MYKLTHTVLFSLLLFIFTVFTAVTQVFAGPVKLHAQKSWTIQEARTEGFEDVTPQAEVSQYGVRDPQFEAHQPLLAAGGGKLGKQVITVFDSGNYAVVDYSEGNHPPAFYYSVAGYLRFVQYDSGGEFPSKSYKHCAGSLCEALGYPSGQLLTVSVAVSETESFIFDPTGRLLAHWVGSECYTSTGGSCGSRTKAR